MPFESRFTKDERRLYADLAIELGGDRNAVKQVLESIGPTDKGEMPKVKDVENWVAATKLSNNRKEASVTQPKKEEISSVSKSFFTEQERRAYVDLAIERGGKNCHIHEAISLIGATRGMTPTVIQVRNWVNSFNDANQRAKAQHVKSTHENSTLYAKNAKPVAQETMDELKIFATKLAVLLASTGESKTLKEYPSIRSKLQAAFDETFRILSTKAADQILLETLHDPALVEEFRPMFMK